MIPSGNQPLHSDVLHDCLRRLVPHLDTERVALTGGVAIGLHLGVSPRGRMRRLAAGDVDFVAEDANVVRQTVTTDFLVSHFHLPQPGYPKFLVQLVDPATRLRLDFFPDALRALNRAPVRDVAGIPLRVLRAQDILDHKLTLLAGASAGSPIEEKHYVDALQLGTVCGREVPELPASHRSTTTYSQDIDAACRRCEVSQCAAFPLAPKRAIFDILGYV